MRALTLKGFLKAYLQYLSGEKTLSISRLADNLETEPRLASPLLLYAVLGGQSDRLRKKLKKHIALQEELGLLAIYAKKGELENVLEASGPGLSEGVIKVWQSYKARRDASSRDMKLKQAIRKRVLALEADSSVTRYRLAKDLYLNPGNLHAFLTFGDVGKLSLNKAYKLLDYLKE